MAANSYNDISKVLFGIHEEEVKKCRYNENKKEAMKSTETSSQFKAVVYVYIHNYILYVATTPPATVSLNTCSQMHVEVQ